ncbi:MAG: 3-hydroxyacyl-CoA dehydrogenase NAD-binding domain-containing protein [Bdellovibrionales bacterium]
MSTGECIGIIGAGRMGCGMAQVIAEAGICVVLIDVRVKSLEIAIRAISENLTQKVAKGAMTPEAREEALGHITTGTDFGLLRKCSFCIEVVLDNAEIKSVMHSKAREAAGSGVVIVSNTANLCIETLAKNIEAPENFMGMIFAYPPLTALDVKLIPHTRTSPASVNLAQRLMRAIGKNPIIQADKKEIIHVPFGLLSKRVFAGIYLALAVGPIAGLLVADKIGLWIASAVGAVVGGLLVLWLARRLNERQVRLANLVRAMAHVAADDLSVTVPYLDREDSFGKIGRLLETFKVVSTQLNKSQEEEKNNLIQAKHKLAEEFNKSITGIVNAVASEAVILQSDAKSLSDMADQTSRQSAAVAAATEEASANIQSVAAAAEQLSASITEINRQVGESSTVAMSAVDEVRHTNATVATLSEAAEQIGGVVKLIQDIAAQTNLLALNATIEAARAGEAGKGFAVVASEVKNLANQTSGATEEISKKINTVQNVSLEAAQAIHAVGTTIEHISNISDSIAKAVQQQTEATREISKNVQEATAGTNEVSSNILKVTDATSESRSGAEKVLTSSGKLSQEAEHMRDEIESFIKKIKAE